MVIVSIAVFVLVVLLLWKAAKTSAGLHRRAYRSNVQPPEERAYGYRHLYGEGNVQEVTNVVNVYPGRDQGYHAACLSDTSPQHVSQPYETGYTGLWE